MGKGPSIRHVIRHGEDAARAAYLEIVTGRLEQRRIGLQSEAEKAQATAVRLRRELLENCRREEEARLLLAAVQTEQGRTRTLADLAQEFENIAKFPQVDHYTVEDQCLVVETHCLTHKERGEIGTFAIRIRLVGGRPRSDHFGVEGVTITPSIVRQNHPHYFPGQKGDWGKGFCFGSAVPPIVEAMTTCQPIVTLDLVLRYLEQG